VVYALKIIHVDMDAFFASVEQRDNPELRGKPVIVGGQPDSRGVVAAASYEARRFGIHSAMTCAQAARMCPHAIFVPPDHGKYRTVSTQIREIFHEITHLVEPLSLDEAYLDVTENQLDEPLAGKVALHIKRRIRKELQLTASAGVGPNKFIAKVASDINKPDGIYIVPPDRVMAFVEGLPVEKLWSVGPATASRLRALGLRTAGDVRRQELTRLQKLLGRQGAFIHRLSHGEDPRRVEPHREAKSRSAETTFAVDARENDVVEEALSRLVTRVSRALRKLGRPGRQVTLKIRYSDFTTITRSCTLTRATDDEQVILSEALELLRNGTEVGERAVRLVGIGVGSLVGVDDPIQLELALSEENLPSAAIQSETQPTTEDTSRQG